MKSILEVDGVVLEFGGTSILQDVYLKCQTGEVVGVLGRNGTGKSSLFKILFGEITVRSQSVRINGSTYTTSHRPTRDMRYLPQHNFVPTHLRSDRVLRDFGVNQADLVSSFPEFASCRTARMRTLSSGQRRIIEIFIILTSRAQFCILDEPFSQVMPIHIDTIKRLVLREKKNKGILVSDHLYPHILDLSDRLYVLSQGKAHLMNTIDDLETLGYVSAQRGKD